MTIHIFIQISGSFDSRILWNLIQPLGVNLTDFGDDIFVYGSISPDDIGQLLKVCAVFGKCTIEIKGEVIA